MRGNDILNPECDVLVADSLTGNILCKMLSSYFTGGMYEAAGFGYGPGIGENYGRLVLILSRASGTPVVANALRYAAGLAKGNVLRVAGQEIAKANQAGLENVKASGVQAVAAAPVAANLPTKEVVTEEISGIEIFDLDDAVALLMQKGIYAESGMGCTGPVVLVNEKKHKTAVVILGEGGFVNA